MADNDQLILRVQTYDNPLTERTDDASGKVLLNGSVGMEELAKDILPSVGDLQYETIMSVASRLVDAAEKRLKMGCAVNFGICHARPVVLGPFYGKMPAYNPEVNSIEIAFSATQKLRESMRTARVEVIGQALVGPVINHVLDVKTNEQDTIITPGRNLKIFGVRIEITGDSNQNGVDFVRKTAEGNEEIYSIDASDIVENRSSQLIIVIPENLLPGEYYLQVTTQFSSRSTLTKLPRTYRFEQPLTVVSK